MSFQPTQDQIDWHMHQLRNWMAPNPIPLPQKRVPLAQAFPQDFYVQNVPSIGFYDLDALHTPYRTPPYPQRAQTFADLNDFNFAYNEDNYSYDQGPQTPCSGTADEMSLLDDVASCYSEAPSSYLSSDVTDPSAFDSFTSITRNASVTSQPATSSLQPSTEVDALMKTLQPTVTSATSTSRTSTKVKRHTCPHIECAKSFSQPTHLKIHLRSHTGEKPYTCCIRACGQSFSQLGNLRTHERRHVGQRPNRRRAASDPGGVQAKSGGKVFTQLGNLKAHMNKFHKETLARLSEQFASVPVEESDEERELRDYFRDLYKNSNKGIKGRGRGRKVQVIVGIDPFDLDASDRP